MRVKLIISVNTSWNLINFREGIICALIAKGYEVVAVAPLDKYSSTLNALGCRFVPLSIDNKGTNPVRDLMLLWQYYKILRHERPSIFLAYTIKPNIYGAIAAQGLGIPVVNNIAGLGSVFAKTGLLKLLVVRLYKIALSRSYKVFFQNQDDLEVFLSRNLVLQSSADILPGSGVDLKKFTVAPLPKNESIRFIVVARMLWDKGIAEFVRAASILKNKRLQAEFYLLGFLDVENPSAITRDQINLWVSSGIVRYLGSSDDVSKYIAQSDCVVLPSYYREGVPRSLLEAAAMGRPIVTTDSVGCRDVVDDGINGYLCRPKDAEDLADKMEKIALLSVKEREIMGLKGRKKVEQQFDEQIVINKYLNCLNEILTINS